MSESAEDLDRLTARLREMAGAWGHHVDDRRTWGRAAGALDTLRRELATAEQQATRAAFKACIKAMCEHCRELETMPIPDSPHSSPAPVWYHPERSDDYGISWCGADEIWSMLRVRTEAEGDEGLNDV